MNAKDCYHCGTKARQAAEKTYAYKILKVVKKGEIVISPDVLSRSSVPRQKIYPTMNMLVDCGIFELLGAIVYDYPDWWDMASDNAKRKWRVKNKVPAYEHKRWKRII